jgi:hypothetical protein
MPLFLAKSLSKYYGTKHTTGIGEQDDDEPEWPGPKES